MLNNKIDSTALYNLLLKFESSSNKDELEHLLISFLKKYGFESELTRIDDLTYLTLTIKMSGITLIWIPSSKDYSPLLSAIKEEDLNGFSLENYECIWQLFNAFCRATWQLNPLYKSILEKLCHGKKVEVIGKELNLSSASIKRYMAIVRDLLGAKTNPQAIAIALRKGWL